MAGTQEDVPSLIQTSSNTESEIVKVSSITNFFYDDPTPYAPLPEHTLEKSPCYPIITIEQGYFCRLLPDIKNVHLKSIEHHIKYKDPKAHRALLNL